MYTLRVEHDKFVHAADHANAAPKRPAVAISTFRDFIPIPVPKARYGCSVLRQRRQYAYGVAGKLTDRYNVYHCLTEHSALEYVGGTFVI